jgi:hypothetical protein
MYGIILSSKLIIPNWTDLVNGDEVEEDLAEEEEELPESPTWAPNTWKRAHWLCGRGVLVMFSLRRWVVSFLRKGPFGPRRRARGRRRAVS